MIGLDTNVVIRYIAQDDPVQSQKATRLIESLSSDVPGYIPLVALVEIVWVLEESYGLTKKELIVILETLLRTKELWRVPRRRCRTCAADQHSRGNTRRERAFACATGWRNKCHQYEHRTT